MSTVSTALRWAPSIAETGSASSGVTLPVATARNASSSHQNDNDNILPGSVKALEAALAKNARVHSKKQIRQIADSIQRFGFTNPVLISDDDEIIAGPAGGAVPERTRHSTGKSSPRVSYQSSGRALAWARRAPRCATSFCFSTSALHYRQFKLKDRASADARRNPNSTAVALDDRMADGQAESHTMYLRRE